ncbi:MAG TPA: DUF5916 domain-containing protein [Chitinophagaceae bacterium]|nr:DUF5916 domain-containing protein [Chitinophagaceae bacterium]
MRRSFLLILAAVGLGYVSLAQVKTTRALRITVAPRIDGSLEDAAWREAPVAAEFITNSPAFGRPAHAPTEVKVLYDQTSVYIGAYIHEDPTLVRKQFTARDPEGRADVDYFAVFIDTYRDRQNAFQFQVSSRNVQTDARVSPQFETSFGNYGDLSWDAVWESKVAMQRDGWTVEMRIPYFAIRFPKKDIQEWGIQFLRFSRSLNESAFWSPVDPSVNGFVNQFGTLEGIEQIAPPLRLSFSPYLSGGYRSDPDSKQGYQQEWLRSGGMDLKYGISESFTLDATLIPDFGQVVSDNVVNNISPYEIQFRENRPFFTEGTELFNKSGTFYSRRIGALPELHDQIQAEVDGGALSDYEIVHNPAVTRLYNAVKFSGRTAGNLGIGIFNAVGQPVHARLRGLADGRDTSILTEPLANYNIIVLDQALRNRSSISFTNTNVLRSGAWPDANVSALDVQLYDKRNRFGLQISPKYSHIFDSTGGYDGFSNNIRLGKVSGQFQYYISNQIVTPKYNPNDLGYLQYPNDFSTEAGVSYNIFQPTARFINQRYSLSVRNSYLFKPFEFAKTTIIGSATWIFHNFWDLTVESEVQPVWYNDYFELQTPADLRSTPRVKLKRARNYFISVSGSTDSRKKLYISWNAGFAESPNPDDPYHYVELAARYRFNDRLSMDIDFRRQHDHGLFGYAFLRDAVTDAPILARRRYTDAVPIISGTYNFTSRMNITVRARHFWNKIINTNLYNVKPDGYWTERTDLDPSDYNTNYNAFNLDVFYTWDFRLGSRIILGWKNWLGNDYELMINGSQYDSYLGNAAKMMSTPHGNEFTIRFIYFLNYQQLMPGKNRAK